MCVLKDCQYTVYLYYEIKDSKYPGYLHVCIKTDNILDIHYMAFKTKQIYWTVIYCVTAYILDICVLK